MTGSERLTRSADAAYQGVEGSFSDDAARALLGESARRLGCGTLEEVFHAVAGGRARTAVVPVFNSIAGRVPRSEELIAEYGLRIIGERSIQIVQSLIGLPGVGFDEIRDVHSHPVAIAQCRRFFRAHPHLNMVPAFDTAGSVADLVRLGQRDRAAIAGARAAERWGAVVLAEAIQDSRENVTRFVLLGV
jgi:prephenate dehydratase